jgi:O-antigen ligase
MLGLGLWFALRDRRQRLLLAVILALGTLALIWTYARSAWVGLLAGLLVFGALKGKRALVGALAAVLVVGFAAAQLSPTIKDRLHRGLTSEENLERIYTWKTSLDMLRDHPLTGIGPGNYTPLTKTYRANYNIHWTANSHAHNSYLQIAVESGAPAGLLFGGVLAMLFAFGAARHRDIKDQPARRDLLAGAVGAVAAFAASSLLQHNAGDTEVCMIFLFAAALLVFLVREKTGNEHDLA